MHIFDHQLLPPELWLEILAWAIQSSFRESSDSYAVDYVPFQPAPTDSRDPSLIVKRALTMVCRLWRFWTINHLYRDIRIRHNTRALQRALEAVNGQEGYGRMVRRAVLPYLSTVSSPTKSPTITSIEILRRCSQLEVLVRPRCLLTEALRFDYEVDCLPLPSLRRLEWWHHTEAERSGGINSLGIVLQHAPNIEYLFVGGVVGYVQFTCVCLPSLRTLRLRVINGLLLHQIVSKWILPSITHIILDSPLVEQGLQSVWERFGAQLKVVEFGKHPRFLTSDHLTTCLRGCSSLKDIGYHIFFTKVPETTEGYTSVTTIRLHSAVNNFLYTAEEIWSMLEGHFTFYRHQLTSLQRIVFYGEWRGILCQHRFHTIVQRLCRARNIALELGDGTRWDQCRIL